ncbi:MAG: 30S ribosomal protein S24e [Promethearchaeota archaeon]|nr:MAG: 30S ribosomal protein S24e [Candidatus Lokiarchaeota archaeon]
MSFKLNIIESKINPLMPRREVHFKIEQSTSGTTNRIELKKKIAALETADENLVFVKKVKTSFGNRTADGRANIYDDNATALKFEPKYMIIRNLPKDQREDERAKIREAKRKKK